MFHRLIVAAILLVTALSARASQMEHYRGILHCAPNGVTLELFQDGKHVALYGLDASFARRHDGRIATVEGDLTLPTGENEPPVLYVERITVTAPRARRTDGYRPPANSGERAADALINVAPFVLGL